MVYVRVVANYHSFKACQLMPHTKLYMNANTVYKIAKYFDNRLVTYL